MRYVNIIVTNSFSFGYGPSPVERSAKPCINFSIYLIFVGFIGKCIFKAAEGKTVLSAK